MAYQTYQKPLLIAVAGVAVVSVALYAYTQYSDQRASEPSSQPSLHRSNAVRRPRHRRHWRRGFEHTTIDYNPTERALNNLEERNRLGRGYGTYENPWVFPTSQDLEGVDMRLIPCNLDSIYDYIVHHPPGSMSISDGDSLRMHINGIFLQNFLLEEFPEGYIIGDDTPIIAHGLEAMGIDSGLCYDFIELFDAGKSHALSVHWNPSDPLRPSGDDPYAVQTDGAIDDGMSPQDAIRALDPTADEDGDSEISYSNNQDDPEGSQNMLDLLYHIGRSQARRDGYIHRGVECNSCGVHPIQGIRYHCSNCFDFDLCESCEAIHPHVKSHVFFKIRVPAPSRGNLKQVMPVWYPGDPNACPLSLDRQVAHPLLEQTGMDRTELESLYEQFKCLAGHAWPDPSGINMAIDRKGFDAYFNPSNANKASAANLIYDRIFAYYDQDQDGLISFKEYILGLSGLQDKSRYARLRRIFEGYDLDADGYVDRRDFLRMFRAYYALSKELTHEMFHAQEDFGPFEEEVREVVRGSQPISAAFGGSTLYGHESRTGQDKHPGVNGDRELLSGSNGVLQPDSDTRGDRTRVIGNAALGDRSRNHPFRSFRSEEAGDEPVMHIPSRSSFSHSGLEDPDEVPEEELNGQDAPLQTYGWPPIRTPEPQDITDALGHELPLEDITDPVDRSRVIYAQARRLDAEGDRLEEITRTKAVEDRWRRRQFYLDEEEGMTRPPGYTEPDSSDEEDDSFSDKKHARNAVSSPRRQSMQSRSSSRVRFDDSAIDTDYETRSNASSRSIPLNERWGGYELSQAEPDIGKDILYQAVQQGFNELLDPLFKDKEDEWLEVCKTRHDRRKFRKEMRKFKEALDAANQEQSATSTKANRLTVETLLQKSIQPNALKRPDPEQGEVGTEVSVESSPEPEDHIGLMFRSVSGPGIPRNAVDQGSASKPRGYDPTLPQFRPDHDSESVRSQPESRENPFSGDPAKARALYDFWASHDDIEKEAVKGGGGGKLSFAEFRRKMVHDDEVTEALGQPDTGRAATDNETWESSHDLGRLAFVGTWLEMASF
ncbi:protein phosphatase 3 regulatory subunit [Exophiala viscosa]|uniref:Protein phosphatase 3 regulatory subunit n=1 Tax=Exophiala viscosa TaxID=2486360 RepID=A0AAN6IGF0_9EURO|nr:protein phosphatase 3 regulatory subunit [Exophiala viscosa]